MSHFLQLPLEIRSIIYKYCLIVDCVINPYPSTYELHNLAAIDPRFKQGLGKRVSKPELPTFSILMVSKQLHREASPILYGQNRWKHPQCWENTEPDSRTFSMFDTHEALFKNIEMSFDWRESNFRINHSELSYIKECAGSDVHDSQQESWHDLDQYSFKRSGMELSRLFPHLNSLIVDVARLFCLIGCCCDLPFHQDFQHGFMERLVKDVLRSSIKIVKFIGLLDEEKPIVYGQWGFKEDGTIDRAAIAKRWRFDFPVTWTADDLDHENGVVADPRSPCVFCFDTSVTDESSVSSAFNET